MTERLDTALVMRGLCSTRSRAQAQIAEGAVKVNGLVCQKAAKKITEQDKLELTQTLPFVGRGGYKLRHALEQFSLCLEGCHCLDIGASTGGFTDCMLQNGAATVLAVDVGHGQMAEVLRRDARVTVMEGTDLRSLSPKTKGLPVEFAVCDVSFISLKQILPFLPPLLVDGAFAVLLVKPQFEAGRRAVGKHGVVREERVRRQVLQDIREAAALCGMMPLSDCESPIRGGSGNLEYLLLVQKQRKEACHDESAGREGQKLCHSPKSLEKGCDADGSSGL